jgi:hypothetical protein
MNPTVRRTLLAMMPLALLGCSQNQAPAAAGGGLVGSPEDWLERAATIVQVTNDPEKRWHCDYVSVLAVPDGWDGNLGSPTPAGESALQEMKLATARLGGNLVLLIEGQTPQAEAYLCTE